MKLNFNLYKKESGKWYAEGQFELPDDVYIWSDNVIEKIAYAQDEVYPESIINREFHLVVNEIRGEVYPEGQFWNKMFTAK